MGLGGIAKSLGWQSAMFGDLLGGGSGSTGDLARPYARSAWVRSAIGFVAGPISMRPLIFTQDRRGGDLVIDDAALTTFWEKPARSAGGLMNRQDLIEATVGLIKLKGQCFWIMDDSWDSPRGSKNPLILARHDSMHAVKDGRELLGWIWTDANGGKNQLIPEQVIHHKFWNPYDDVLGLSEWEAAMIAAESDYAGGVFARNLAKNNGDRGPYVIGKGGVFTDEQIKQVSAQLRAKQDMGRRGEFRAAFLPADVDVKDPTVDAVDAAFVAQRLENRKEVYAAFGVPPSYADPQASYSIGSASDRFRLIEDTCMPLAAKIADGMEIVTSRFLGRGETVFVEFDWDSHSTMQQVRAERFETATKAVDRGMPWAQASEYFRLKLPRFPGDEKGRVPFNLTEVESESGMRDAEGEEETSADPVTDLEQLFAKAARTPCTCSAGDPPEPSAAWLRIHKARQPWEKKFKSASRRLIMAARAETLRNLADIEAVLGKSAVHKWGALDALFDLRKWLPDWTRALTSITRAALETAGFEVWKDELDRSDPLTMPAARILEVIRQREIKLADAGTKIHDAVRKEIETAISNGETMDEIRSRVKTAFNGISESRADMIARTETTTAYETARDIAFREAGVEWTQWLTMADLGDRHPSYAGLHNQIRAIDEPFTIYGELTLRYPGDPDGPPAEVINCRCVRIAVMGPDTAGTNNDPTLPY